MNGGPRFEIVLVLGPGRSGTSLMMQLLQRCGVAVSADLVPANEANPEGHWEDRRVVAAHRELLAAFGRDDLAGNAMPLPEGWQSHPAAAVAGQKLRAEVEAARAAHAGPWAVKDPRLTLLMPLWQELARELGVPLRCVLCMRDPVSTANSSHRHYGLDPAIGEALWLNRTCFALEYLSGDFCLVHYEDLMGRPAETLRAVLAWIFAGMPEIDDRLAQAAAAASAIRPELNRSTLERPPLHALAGEIHAALRGRSGVTAVDAPLQALLATYFRSCREHAGWQRSFDVERAKPAATAPATGTAERRRKELRRELDRLRASRSYRIAEMLGAARRSWLRALALPYRLWRLLFGPGQQEQALREKLARRTAELAEMRQKAQVLRGKLARRTGELAETRQKIARKALDLKRVKTRLATLAETLGTVREALQRQAELARKRREDAIALRQAGRELDEANRGLRAKMSNAVAEIAALAWSLKRVLLEVHASRLRGADAPTLAGAFPSVSGGAVPGGSRRRVLYLGPVNFREEIWDTRAKYILPDLFESIAAEAEIHMLTGPVPEFARAGLEALCGRFAVSHSEVSADPYAGGTTEFWLAEALRVAHAIRPDVVTNVFGVGGTGFVVGTVGRLLPCRSVLRIAGDDIGVRDLLGVYRDARHRLERDRLHQNLSCAMTDAIITMSPWEQRRVAAIVNDPARVQVCMRGVDLARFAPEQGRRTEGRRFLYVGRKSLEKGYDLMERAADIVAAEAPEIEFVFAGNFDRGQAGNRRYVGFVQPEELPALYRSVDALILPSRSEGFPQTLAEAMAAGRPCIVPETPFSAMFRHEQEVLLSAPDAESLAAAVLRLHRDPALRARLAEGALRAARDQLDRARWREVYRAVLLGR